MSKSEPIRGTLFGEILIYQLQEEGDKGRLEEVSVKQRWWGSTDGTPSWHCSRLSLGRPARWRLALELITGCKCNQDAGSRHPLIHPLQCCTQKKKKKPHPGCGLWRSELTD